MRWPWDRRESEAVQREREEARRRLARAQADDAKIDRIMRELEAFQSRNHFADMILSALHSNKEVRP